MAQFTGSTLGGATLTRRLPFALLAGFSAAALGFLLFALAPGLAVACAGLLLGGFGVGRIIASSNILAGTRYASERGSALSRLNISFSVGALLSPLLAAQLAPRIALPNLLSGFAAIFAALAVALLVELRGAPARRAAPETGQADQQLRHVFLLFAAVLFLYGGLETCLSGWLTTFALRYGAGSLILSQYTMVLLLAGLAVGHALGARLMRRYAELTVLRVALALTIVAATALATTTHANLLAPFAIMLGVFLAPVFPASFALFMANRPTPRLAGLVLASSGLGAASIPYLMGVVSTRTGSLRAALVLPVAVAVTLLLVFLQRSKRAA